MIEVATSRSSGNLPDMEPAEAAALVPRDAHVLVSGFGSVGYPKAVPLALANDERELDLTIISGGSTGKEIDSALANAGSIRGRYPFQAKPEIRDAINDGTVRFHDPQVYEMGDRVKNGDLGLPDIAIVEAIAVGKNWMIPSLSIGHTPAFLDAVDRLIVEVNSHVPLDLQQVHDVFAQEDRPTRDPLPAFDADERIGSSRVTFETGTLEAVVHTDHPDDGYDFREPSEADIAISEHFVSFFEDEIERRRCFADDVHLQFGVGSMGNALMSALTTASIGERNLIYFGEVMQDGLLDMIDTGILHSASATSLALSNGGQHRFFDNIEEYAKKITLRPASISNNPGVIDRLGIIGVNSALEIDFYGHVNSTHVDGKHLVNGIGGSADYNRNSEVTVIALPSTAADGDISRVVPMVPHVDHTEHDVDIILTEQGYADLRGLSPAERADVIIDRCAHPSYREDLYQYLRRARTQGGHICHDLETVFRWSSRKAE